MEGGEAGQEYPFFTIWRRCNGGLGVRVMIGCPQNYTRIDVGFWCRNSDGTQSFADSVLNKHTQERGQGGGNAVGARPANVWGIQPQGVFRHEQYIWDVRKQGAHDKSQRL